MKKNALLALAIGLSIAAQARAVVVITEVNPAGSTAGNGYSADWFELTNFGVSTVNINSPFNWTMDDSSAAFATSFPLSGITTIAPGESVIFLESAGGAAIPNFLTTWFGGSPPPGLQVGFYSGSAVGLSTTSDGVNIFDSSTPTFAWQVSFNAAPANSATFDNAIYLPSGSTISQSSEFVAWSFASASLTNLEIGSPGVVPEPSSMALAGVVIAGFVSRRVRNKRRLANASV